MHIPSFRTLNRQRAVLLFAASCFIAAARLLADEGGSGEIQPAPPSIGSDVPVTYFGPAPSTVEPDLVGPHQLLTSGNVDLTVGTVTLPLYRGTMRNSGKPVWYVLTDTDDKGNAEGLGINYSAKLTYAATCKAARNGEFQSDGSIRCTILALKAGENGLMSSLLPRPVSRRGSG